MTPTGYRPGDTGRTDVVGEAAQCQLGTVELMRTDKRAVAPSPVFLAVVGVTLLGGVLAWSDDGSRSGPARSGAFLLVAGGWVVSLCLHEFCHAFAAYRAGDHSVEAAGYLTLNPLKYAHPLLSIGLPLLFIIQGGIGLPGGAVYLHPHDFRRRWMQSVVAAVGPGANVVFAAVLLGFARSHDGGTHLRFWGALAFLGFLQITAAVLNLLPIPGLDGYAIIEPYLSAQTRHAMEPIKAWGMLGVIVLLQARQLNARFFDVVLRVYDASGASRNLYAVGYDAFRFWTG